MLVALLGLGCHLSASTPRVDDSISWREGPRDSLWMLVLSQAFFSLCVFTDGW